jgi:hypothetical protein
MKMLKKGILFAFTLVLLFQGVPLSQAFTSSVSSKVINAVPGETYEIKFQTIPREHEIGQDMLYVLEIGGYQFNENGQLEILEGDLKENEPWYSVSSWVDQQSQEIILNDEKGAEFTINVKVPEDAQPGSYYFAALNGLTEADPETLTASGSGSVGKITRKITINIAGETDENMELLNFDINEVQYKKGNIVFDAEFKNDSKVELIPTGTIKIYDKNGEQIEKIIAVVEELPDGQKILKETRDEIKFNPSGIGVEPSITKTLSTNWENRTVKAGEYTVKADIFFGATGKISKEIDLKINESLEIVEFSAGAAWNDGLPVRFNVSIKNNGGSNLGPIGSFVIKDVWGNTVLNKDISQFFIEAGKEFTLTNLVWESGFAMGSYTAILTIEDPESGLTTFARTTFIVMNWWQTIGALLIILIVLVLIIGGFKKYSKMKKRLEKAEHKTSKE